MSASTISDASFRGTKSRGRDSLGLSQSDQPQKCGHYRQWVGPKCRLEETVNAVPFVQRAVVTAASVPGGSVRLAVSKVSHMEA